MPKIINKKKLKLYDIAQESKILCEVSDGSKFVIFHHLDGAYSYCTSEKGGIIHLSGSTPLVPVSNGVYKIKE
jgi:hypothetical protein